MSGSAPGPDGNLADVEQRVDDELDRLEAQDTITAEDLERFRQTLPINPEMAELVQLALPFPFSEMFEFVRGSERQSAYWRLAPDRSEPRSEAERRARERFATATQSGDGRGTIELADGKIVPVSAARAKAAQDRDQERGADAGADVDVEELTSGERRRGRQALRRLRSLVGLDA